MGALCDSSYDVFSDADAYKYKLENLMRALELEIPVSLYCKEERLVGYVTSVDVSNDRFLIEMPGEFEREGNLNETWRFQLDLFENMHFSAESRVKIWVDDVREVPEGYIGTKSVNETIALIKEIENKDGQIELLDLDHDLGDYARFGGDAIKILDYLAERGTFYPIAIHTANPVGRANMERMIKRFWP